MVLSFLNRRKETPASLRRRAEELLSRAEDMSRVSSREHLFGENRLRQAGFESDFRQFREYAPGDRPQDIDWKRSARSDDTLVREREKQRLRTFNLYLESNKGMHFASSSTYLEKYETGAVFALAFSLWAKRNHDAVYFEERNISPDELATSLLDRSTRPFEPRRNAINILIGDFLSPLNDIEYSLSSLPPSNTILLQIFDRAEIELPWNGRHIFESEGHREIVDDTGGIRRDYQAALSSHNAALRELCRSRHWHYAQIRTDEDYATAFSKALFYIGNPL